MVYLVIKLIRFIKRHGSPYAIEHKKMNTVDFGKDSSGPAGEWPRNANSNCAKLPLLIYDMKWVNK